MHYSYSVSKARWGMGTVQCCNAYLVGKQHSTRDRLLSSELLITLSEKVL